MRPLHERYDELKMLKLLLVSLKTRSIAMLLTVFLRKTGEVALFFISPYSRAKVSIYHFCISSIIPE